LNELPDFTAASTDIEEIFGKNFYKIEDLIIQSRRFASGIVIAEMKLYQNSIKKYASVFNDFYDLMDEDIDPDTMVLNKDTYTIFYGIP